MSIGTAVLLTYSTYYNTAALKRMRYTHISLNAENVSKTVFCMSAACSTQYVV